MSQEIERKFLVNANMWKQLEKPEATIYRQGYLSLNGKATVRLRASDREAFLTIKSATLELSRKEFEYKIPLNDALEMMGSLTGKLVEKKRYKIRFDGKLWEVDEFLGDNEGLLMAEIELESESEQVKLPDWITEEVTGDRRYYNSFLSEHPFRSWDKESR